MLVYLTKFFVSEPDQSPAQLTPGLCPGGTAAGGGDVGHPAPRFRMCGATQLLPHTLSGRVQGQGYLPLPSLIELRELYHTANVIGARFSY